MAFKSVQDVLINHQDYIIGEIVARFKARPWSPYQEFMLKSDYFNNRAEIFLKFFIEGLRGNTELLLSDQEESTYGRATKGFHLTNTWSPHHIFLDTIFELLEKLEGEEKLNFESVYGEMHRLESLLLSLYEVLALTFIRSREEIVNEKTNQIQALQDFTDTISSAKDTEGICSAFLENISRLIKISEFILLLFRDDVLVDTYSILDPFNLKHLQPAIDLSISKGCDVCVEPKGTLIEGEFQFKQVMSAVIPVFAGETSELKAALVLHNHEKGFSLQKDEIDLLHHFLKLLSLGLESVFNRSSLESRQAGAEQLKSKFTARELDVLKLLSDGHSDKEIADLLFISKHTVRTHVKNLFKKMKVSSRSQIIVKSIQERVFSGQ